MYGASRGSFYAIFDVEMPEQSAYLDVSGPIHTLEGVRSRPVATLPRILAHQSMAFLSHTCVDYFPESMGGVFHH